MMQSARHQSHPTGRQPQQAAGRSRYLLPEEHQAEPAGYADRRPASPRRSRALPTALGIVLSLAAVAVLGYIVVSLLNRPPAPEAGPVASTTASSPARPTSSATTAAAGSAQTRAGAFWTDLAKGNYAAAHAQFNPALQKEQPLAAFKTSMSGVGLDPSCTYAPAPGQESPAAGTETRGKLTCGAVTFDTGISYGGNTTLQIRSYRIQSAG